jgi:flavin-dependent dehydrogenase
VRTADVAVLGGGPAGAAVALLLAHGGARVVLYESSDYSRPRMGETLPPSVNPLLRSLGLWDRFAALHSTPSYQTASAWGDDEIAARSFLFSPYGHGWHVDRARFDAMLTQAAADAGAHVLRGIRAHRVLPRDDGPGYTIEADQPTQATTLVDATGRPARFACRLGARRVQLDRLVCAAQVFATPPGPAGPADSPGPPVGDTFIEAVADGWWYVSPLPGGQRLVACFTDAGHAAQTGLGTAAGWAAALARTNHLRHLATGSETGPIRLVTAASHHLQPCLGPGWLAVGDAALAVDPLSSGGVTFALRSAITAARAVLGGNHEDHTTMIDAAAAEYHHLRTEIYGWETRFTSAPFWQSRTSTRTPNHHAAPPR